MLASAMASGAVDRLPRLTRHASPEFAHALLGAYLVLLDEVDRHRAAEGATWSLSDRVAASSVRADITGALRHTWDWLVRCAHRGGQGVSVAGAFSPAAVRAFLRSPSPAEPAADRGRRTSPPEGEPDAGSTAPAAALVAGHLPATAADVLRAPVAGLNQGVVASAPS